jgi:hypothetical protein
MKYFLNPEVINGLSSIKKHKDFLLFLLNLFKYYLQVSPPENTNE